MPGTSAKAERQSRWRRIGRLLRKGLILYLLVVIVLAALQRKLLYFPSIAESLPIANFRIITDEYAASEDVEIKCSDNVTIKGWLLRKQGSHTEESTPRPLVLYFHGNGGNRAGRAGWYQLFSQLDLDVLAVDYHGYGDSGGSMSESGLESDCDAAWNYAVSDLGYQPDNIYVVGTSLGGAAAVYLTAKQSRAGTPPAGLAVVATFSSMVDAARTHYPWLPVNLILVDRYPSDARIGDVTCPLLMFHGDVDRVVPLEIGRKLYDAAPEESAGGIPKRWVELPGIGHKDLIKAAGSVIGKELRGFIERTHPTKTSEY